MSDYRKQWAEGEIEAGTLLDAIDALAAENERLLNESSAKLAGVVEALRTARELIAHGDFADGYCMCGMRIDTHDSGMQSGHAPCDAGEYYAGQVMEQIDAAMAAAGVGDE